MIASNRVAVPIKGIARDKSKIAGTVCTSVAALFVAFDTVLKSAEARSRGRGHDVARLSG